MVPSSPSHFAETIAAMQELNLRSSSRMQSNLGRMRAKIEELDRADLGSDPSPAPPPSMTTGLHPAAELTKGGRDDGPEALLRSFLPPRGRGADGGDYGRSVLGSVLVSYLGRDGERRA